MIRIPLVAGYVLFALLFVARAVVEPSVGSIARAVLCLPGVLIVEHFSRRERE